MKTIVQLMEETQQEKDNKSQLRNLNLTISEVENLIKKALKANKKAESVTILISKRKQEKFVEEICNARFRCIHKGEYPAPEISGETFILYELRWK